MNSTAPAPADPATPWTAELLAKIGNGFARQDTGTLLAWALASFAPELCMATSFGPQSIVLMHLLSRLQPAATVFYLDTALLFPETYALRDELSRRLGMKFTRVATELSLEDQERAHGPSLWARDPNLCCRLRKVRPLRGFLSTQKAWITGIRRATTADRAGTRLVEWDSTHGLVKLNPLANWTAERVWNYLHENLLPFNPLHEDGYPSIGCQPCTRPVRHGEDPRAGRWSGFAKTECGIHVAS
jgi:phosphoadenosine phosphosulfate reductase